MRSENEFGWDILIWSCFLDIYVKGFYQLAGVWGLNFRERIKVLGVEMGCRSCEKLVELQEWLGMVRVVK